MDDATTKRCPYCAEEIRAEAIKCRYCGSLLGSGRPLARTWYRSRHGKMIAGICAGLAREFGISVTILRVAFLLSVLVGWGMGLIVYAVLWVVMPYRPYEMEDATSSTGAGYVPPIDDRPRAGVGE